MATQKIAHRYKGHVIHRCENVACEAWHVRSIYGGGEIAAFSSVRAAKVSIAADNADTARLLAQWKIS